jgi:drug/metabolite transporter (DMT)-like permease
MPGAQGLGRLIVLIFAILTAAKEVVAGSLSRHLNIALVVVVAFTTTSLFFHLLRRARSETAGTTDLARQWPSVVWLNLSSVAAWGTIFYALQFIEPAIASALAVATLPLFTLGLQRVMSAQEPTYPCDLMAGIAISLSVFFLAVQARHAPLGIGTASFLQLSLSVLACLICALGMAFSNLIAKQLYDAGWKPADVMAHRFYALVLVAAGWLVITQAEIGHQFTEHGVKLAVFALLGVAIPVYLLQHGVKRAPPVEVAALIALSPIMVVVFQLFDPDMRFNPVTAIGVIATVAIVIVYFFARDRARKALPPQAAIAK